MSLQPGSSSRFRRSSSNAYACLCGRRPCNLLKRLMHPSPRQAPCAGSAKHLGEAPRCFVVCDSRFDPTAPPTFFLRSFEGLQNPHHPYRLSQSGTPEEGPSSGHWLRDGPPTVPDPEIDQRPDGLADGAGIGRPLWSGATVYDPAFFNLHRG